MLWILKFLIKNVVTQSNCVTSEKKWKYNNELKHKILKTAAIYETEKKDKEKLKF